MQLGMKVNVKWIGKMGFTGESLKTHNTIRLDTSVENHGEGLGVSPMEVVLMGLAGCSGMDVVSILRKRRVEFDQFNILIEGERASEHPKVFTNINMIFSFSGTDLKEQVLADTIGLSINKYCSVAGMLNKSAKINWQVRIE